MLKKIITLISITLIGLTTLAQNEAVKVILLAGQSNMSGAGDFDKLSKEDQKAVKKAAKNITISRQGKKAIPLAPVFSKFQLKKRGFGNVFGPELFLGIELVKKFPNQKFLFIKTSQGGTSLYGAWNPNWSAKKANKAENKDFKKKLKLYENFVSNINTNLIILKQNNLSYKIMGMLWMQGEADTNADYTSSSYEKNLSNLITKIRKNLSIKTLPFVIGQVNNPSRKFKEGVDLVRTAMEKVARTTSNVAMVSTSTSNSWRDFPKHTDNLHYNAIGQKRLGTAFAKKLLQLQN